MLQNLVIKNIALIESAEIEFDDGLNVLTGETGAGKSILLDSVGLLLGDRVDKTLLRSGESSCKVVGKFVLDEFSKNSFKEFCTKYDFQFEDEIIISRSFTNEGKSDIRINGEPSTLAMLKELSSNLVDSYGQNESQTLFDAGEHIELLDDFAGTQNTKEYIEYTKNFAELKKLEVQLKSFGGSQEERLKNMDILAFQIDEIENANISIEDFADLEGKRHRLLNMGKIASSTTLAQNYLDMDVLSNISKAKASLEQVETYDNSLTEFAERLESVKIELSDILESVKDYNRNIDFSEAEQQKMEDRYSLYTKLMRKYGRTVEEVLIAYNNMKNEFELLKNADQEINKLTIQKGQIESKMLELGKKISSYRKEKAKVLCEEITKNLKKLNMKNSVLEFVFENQEKLLSNGIDEVELLFSANLGEEKKPLSKIASGGEMSRFMLALKSVIAKVDHMPTMIFDEIDTGISGATSEAVAKQMAMIGKNHQVIAVTHSQQIASMADTNFLIKKTEKDVRTVTLVKKLNDKEKLEEVARFLSGEAITAQSLENAQKLIDEQAEYKRTIE